MAKSKVFFFNSTCVKQMQILKVLGFKKGQLPCKYLGLPLAKGIQSGGIWNSLFERFKERLSSWKNRWLSWARRLTMLKYVISTLPIYMMSCLPLSVGNNKSLNRVMKDFFWKGNSDQKKFPLMKW